MSNLHMKKKLSKMWELMRNVDVSRLLPIKVCKLLTSNLLVGTVVEENIGTLTT